MSVPVRKRGEGVPSLKAYDNAVSIRKAVALLIQRDLGIKTKVRNLCIRTRPMDEETQRRFIALAQKYDMPIKLAEYPEWLAVEAKTSIEHSLTAWTAEMDDFEREEFLSIAVAYGISCLSADADAWTLDEQKKSLWQICRSLEANIAHAYTIWPTCHAEYEERRVLMDRAIGDCEFLKRELVFTLSVLPVNADKNKELVERINHEVALLKNWRKSDNKRAKAIN